VRYTNWQMGASVPSSPSSRQAAPYLARMRPRAVAISLHVWPEKCFLKNLSCNRSDSANQNAAALTWQITSGRRVRGRTWRGNASGRCYRENHHRCGISGTGEQGKQVKKRNPDKGSQAMTWPSLLREGRSTTPLTLFGLFSVAPRKRY